MGNLRSVDTLNVALLRFYVSHSRLNGNYYVRSRKDVIFVLLFAIYRYVRLCVNFIIFRCSFLKSELSNVSLTIRLRYMQISDSNLSPVKQFLE